MRVCVMYVNGRSGVCIRKKDSSLKKLREIKGKACGQLGQFAWEARTYCIKPDIPLHLPLLKLMVLETGLRRRARIQFRLRNEEEA